MDHDTLEAGKNIMDVVSALAVLGMLFDHLPGIAAFFTIVWTILRIYEMIAVHGIFRRKEKDGAKD